MLGSIPWSAAAAAGVVVMTLLGALMGAALVLTPLLFTGSSQYPWTSLAHIRWFQVVCACNPMTYVSEGLRGLMVPGVPTSRRGSASPPPPGRWWS